MKAKAAQYLNEVVSLTVLVLMVLALVSGKASSAPDDGFAAVTPDRETVVSVPPSPVTAGDRAGSPQPAERYIVLGAKASKAGRVKSR